jgi:hypothetical protein
MPVTSRHSSTLVIRFLLGMAASGGLICAACLSALPSAACPEMAETYSLAIRTMGFGSLVCLLTAEAWSLNKRERMVRDPVTIGATVMTAGVFFMALITSDVNLKAATKVCVAAMPSSHTSSVKILKPYDIWRIFQEPYRSL